MIPGRQNPPIHKRLLALRASACFLGFVLGGLPGGFRAATAEHDAVLLDEALEIRILSLQEATVTHRRRVQVLTPRGADHYGAIEVGYRPGVRVQTLRGVTVLPSGKRLKSGSKDLIDGSDFAEYELYSDSRRKILRHPGVVPGAILETESQLRLDSLFHLPPEFRLQEEIPVGRKLLLVEHPAALPVRFAYDEGVAAHEIVEAGSARTHRWMVEDVEPFRRDRMSPPARDLIPTVRIYPGIIRWEGHDIDTGTWGGIAAWYQALTSDRIVAEGDLVAVARRLTEGREDPEKIRALYEYLQRNVTYVAVELGIGGWQPHLSMDVFRNQYGDCKDKATLLIAMLRAVGLDGQPVLVRTRDSGLLDAGRPSLAFNHAMVAIPRDGGYLFLDPTSEYSPYGDLPWVDQGVPVLVVGGDGGGRVETTPLFPPERNRIERHVSGRLDATGELSGDYVLDLWGQSRARFDALLRGDARRAQAELAEYLGTQIPGALLVSHEAADSPGRGAGLRLSLRFRAPGHLKRAGEYRLLPPHLARSADLTALSAQDGRRQTVFFPYLYHDFTESRVELPEGYEPVGLPEPGSIRGPGLRADFDYSMEAGERSGILVARRSVEVFEREVPARSLPGWREALTALAREDARAVRVARGGA